MRSAAGARGAALLLVAPTPLLAAPVPDYGYDWAVIGDVNNPAIPASIGGVENTGRGSVGYSFRMARTEITTADWLEFINAVSPNFPEYHSSYWRPTHSGMLLDGGYNGPGYQWRLEDDPNAAQWPVGGISWRSAAMMCNWLHNGKVEEKWAFEDGAYDISTFGGMELEGFTDQATRHADAQFWIPSLDEWLKASHYDPNRNGAGEGGWWVYPYMSDEPPVSGLPGEPGAQTNTELDLPGFAEWRIPVGSYPDAVAAYGLLDVSGGASEMNEEIYFDFDGTARWRGMDGSSTGYPGSLPADQLHLRTGAQWPGASWPRAGLRLASVVPSPAAFWLGAGIVMASGGRTRRKDVR